MLGFASSAAHPTDWPRRRIAPVFARRGMVAAGHPLAAAAGLGVLRDGGNAVDAAVASGLVAAVVMPEMCGLGGDLFAVVHAPGDDSSSGETVSVQGSGAAPRSATVQQMRDAGDGGSMPSRGPLSITVPGMVHGYFTLLERYGSRLFAELVEPAIEYAEGYPISPVAISYVTKFADLLSRFPSSAEVFLPGGSVPKPGDVFRQPDLAATLRTLARDGAGAFYQGEVADRIGAAVAALGGALSADDMKDHQTAVTPPISTTYRGHTVYETRLPSQGLIVLEALNIAERFDLEEYGAGSAAATHVLVEAVKLAFADRIGYCRDPAFGDSPVDELLSKEWAARRAGEIGRRARDDVSHGSLTDEHTSYLCVVDGAGMMVSLIQSVAANFGSGIVADGTGVVLNNRASAFSLAEGHPNAFAPGKKTVHTLNCYLITDRTGRPVLVGGTPGGDRQPQWNLQVISGLVDAGWDVQQAVEQPLWISAASSGGLPPGSGRELRLEDRVTDQVRRELAERGHDLRIGDGWGCDSVAQVIARDPDTGALAGGTDPRAEGLALGF